MHESLLLVSQHFSNYSPLIQNLFQGIDMFREICVGYHKCNNAFHLLEQSVLPGGIVAETGILRPASGS